MVNVSIQKPRLYPWFTDIEDSLLQYARSYLLQPRGITLESYGTYRYVTRNANADRFGLGTISNLYRGHTTLEYLPEPFFAEHYWNIGIRQQPPTENQLAHAIDTISNAYSYLEYCPSLCKIVNSLVLSVHILQGPDDDVDVSFSDPNVPLSVFISIPPKSRCNIVLRVCESIIHESMHLHLTLVEHQVSLIADNRDLMKSPWRDELRPPRGIIHGVYVFRAILEYFRSIESRMKDPVVLNHVHRRTSQIQSELLAGLSSLQSAHLTNSGNALLANLRKGVNAD